MPYEKWRSLMDLNLTSAFLCTKHIGKAMIERGQGGRVINICSINSLVAGRGIAGRHYETAKGALIMLVVGIVPVIGPIALFVASWLGFGSILLSAWAARERQLA